MTKRKKTVMRTLKISEISGVDVPAQEGARAVIMKRAGEEFGKASALTSPEDGHSHLVALNGPPDGVELNSGFTSFENGHSHPWVRGPGGEIVIGTAQAPDGGAPHIHRVAFMSKQDGDVLAEEFEDAEDDEEEKEELDELVDTMKRQFTADQRKKLAETGEAMKDGSFPIVTTADLSNAIQAFGRAKDKPAVARHIRRRAKALDAMDKLPETGELAGMSKNAPADVAGRDVGEKEKTMTDLNKKAAEQVDDLKAQLAKSNMIAALNDAEKAYYQPIAKDAAGDDFLKMDAGERQKLVAAHVKEVEKRALDADPVVYTTMDGHDLRKSAGAAFIEIAKSNDALRKQLAASQEATANMALEKRAEEELPHVPGTVQQRAAMLKALDGIEDEGNRAAAHAALKAQNDAMAFAFTTKGHVAATSPAGSPEAELEKMAAEHQAKNPGMSMEKAHADVMATPAGAELYAKSVN